MSNAITLHKVRYYKGELAGKTFYTFAPPKARPVVYEDDGGKEYALPEGYTQAKGISGEQAVFDASGNACSIIAFGALPAVSSPWSPPVPLSRIYAAGDESPIRKYRKLRGLTLNALATAAGLDISQIKRLESGQSDIRKAAFINGLTLARILGIEPEELL